MQDQPTPMDPGYAERRFAEMLEEAGLPRFDSSFHDPAIHELQLSWDHGLTIHIDLTRWDHEPIDDCERASILGQEAPACGSEPIHVTVHGSPEDPRLATSTPEVVIHRAPPLHPDDVTVHNGIPVTSPSRTLVAEVLP